MASIVLITGTTGHIGSHVALYFLKQGWTVHATGRSLEKMEDFMRLPTFKPFVDRVKLFEIQNQMDGDYSVALQDVQVVSRIIKAEISG
jgi:nucleoside-diphosphate-sugar epimerase